MFSITNIPNNIKSYKIKNSVIVLVEYLTRYELCSSFMRCQEFYESEDDSINGCVFTLEDFMDAYSRRFGSFSYTMDWSGFNIPSVAFLSFFEKFTDLLKKEKILHESIMNEINKYSDIDSFYVIGSYQECPNQAGVIYHELAHSLFKLDKKYRTKMSYFVDKYLFKEHLFYTLKTEWGYSNSVLVDEAQAYMATNNKDEWNEFSKVPMNIKNGFNEYSVDYVNKMNKYFLDTTIKYGIDLPPLKSCTEINNSIITYRDKYKYNAGESLL